MAENQDKDQRTEDATPNRIRKAREDGQLGFSAEFLGGLMLATAAGLAWLFGETFFRKITDAIAYRISHFDEVLDDPRMIVRAVIDDSQTIGFACLAYILPIGLVALSSGLIQNGFNLSSKPLELDLTKLSVIKGLGQIFSSKSLVRAGLSIVKVIMILGVVYVVAKSKLDTITIAGTGSFAILMRIMAGVLLQASLAIACLILIVGIIDLAYQRWKHLEEIKMSMQDIKDENKETEGDPMIKARVKRLQAEMGRKRMLKDVPQADVVITNPTHYAVAVRYDRETMDAPIVVAKGADFLAKKIIEIAKQNDVAVVERKPVARFLYAHTEIGSAVPFELYQAIAEILNFVNKVKRAA